MTELLEKYLKLAEEKKENKRYLMLIKTEEALQKLSGEIPFRQAYIFGSILRRKKFYYDSDIDIAVCGLNDKVFFRFMSRLMDILGRNVDVIQLENHRLKDKIIREGLLWKKPD